MVRAVRKLKALCRFHKAVVEQEQELCTTAAQVIMWPLLFEAIFYHFHFQCLITFFTGGWVHQGPPSLARSVDSGAGGP